jgi:hypothetical protein
MERFPQMRHMFEFLREARKVVTCRQYNRHTARHEFVGKGEGQITVQLYVKDGGVERLSSRQFLCLLQPANRSDDFPTQALDGSLDVHRYEEVIFNNKDSQSAEIARHLIHFTVGIRP